MTFKLTISSFFQECFLNLWANLEKVWEVPLKTIKGLIFMPLERLMIAGPLKSAAEYLTTLHCKTNFPYIALKADS